MAYTSTTWQKFVRSSMQFIPSCTDVVVASARCQINRVRGDDSNNQQNRDFNQSAVPRVMIRDTSSVWGVRRLKMIAVNG